MSGALRIPDVHTRPGRRAAQLGISCSRWHVTLHLADAHYPNGWTSTPRSHFRGQTRARVKSGRCSRDTVPKDTESRVCRIWVISLPLRHLEMQGWNVHGVILPRFLFLEERAPSAHITKSTSPKGEGRLFRSPLAPIRYITDGFPPGTRSTGLRLQHTAKAAEDLGGNVEFQAAHWKI